MRSDRRVALASLLGTGVLIGLSTNLTKVASDAGLGALAFLTWTVAGAAVLLGVATALRGSLTRFDRPRLEYFAVSGLISLAAPNLLLFAAIPHVGPAFAVLSLVFPPLYTYLGALVFRMESWSVVRALAVSLALFGGGWLAVAEFRSPDASPGWIVATLTVPVLLAAGNLYRSARWPAGATPEELAPGMLAASAVMLLVFGTASGALGLPPRSFSLSLPAFSSTIAWLLIGHSVILAASYALFFVLQKTGGPVYLSLIGSVAAVTGVPFAVVWLDETLPDGLLVAGVLITAGVAMLTRSQGSRHRAST